MYMTTTVTLIRLQVDCSVRVGIINTKKYMFPKLLLVIKMSVGRASK